MNPSSDIFADIASEAQARTATDTLVITLGATHRTAPFLEELLWTLPGVISVEEVYGQAITQAEHDQTRPEDLEAVRVFFQSDESADAIAARIDALLQATPDLAGCRVQARHTLAEADWAESWKRHWKPTPIHEALTICPSWERYAPRADETVIYLDPGAAFGTGAHETTRLMLTAMHALSRGVDFSRCAVLDVGTGSGILAIYAAQLGSASVTGIDNDPKAIPICEANARLNGVERVCRFSDAPLDTLCLTRHEVVLANIIAPVILSLLPEMLARLADGGHLLLSGLIEKTVGNVQEAVQAAGLSVLDVHRQGDWYCLHAQR